MFHRDHHVLGKLRDRVDHYFNIEELRLLCFDLGIEYEHLAGDSRPSIILSLLQYLNKHRRIPDLIAELNRLRPHVNWEEVTPTEVELANIRPEDLLQNYRQQMLKETKYVELKGIPLPFDRHGRYRDPLIPLDDIYIPLRGITENESRYLEKQEERDVTEKASSDEFPDSTHYDRSTADLWRKVPIIGNILYQREPTHLDIEHATTIDLRNALEKYGRLVVLGNPGSGKSTMLGYLARRVAEDIDGPVPILVSLREFATAYLQDRQLTLRHFALLKACNGDEQVYNALSKAVTQGNVLWLLDALDEARYIADEAAQQAGRLIGNLIITSRSIGYVGTGLRTLPHLEILPITSEDVNKFIRDWLQILYKEAATPPYPIDNQVDLLESHLTQHPKLREITRTPLLLTFLISLAGHAEVPELPKDKAGLYSAYINALCNREISRRELKENLDKESFQLGSLQGESAKQAAKNGFGYLGWALHLQYFGGRANEIPTSESIKSKLASCFSREGYSDPDNLAAAVFVFWREAGMLTTWTIDKHAFLAFRHLTFQEYGAAWTLARAWAKDSNHTWGFLLPRLHHYNWREPLSLLAGIMSKQHFNELVYRILRGQSSHERALKRDLRLAGSLLADDTYNKLDTPLPEKIIHHLDRQSHNYELQRTVILFLIFFLGVRLISQIIPEGINGFGVCLWVVLWAICFLPFFTRPYDYLMLPFRLTGPFIKQVLFLEPLAKIGPPAQKSLINALKARDPSIREAAIIALGRTGKAKFVPLIIESLSDEILYVRTAALEALGNIGDASVVPILAEAIDDEHLLIRSEAIKALGKIRNDNALSVLIRALDQSEINYHRQIANTLKEIGEAAIPYLAKVLDSNYREARIEAVYALRGIGDAALPILVDALNNTNEDVRISATIGLGELGASAYAPVLVMRLADQSANVRRETVSALGQIGDFSIVPALFETLRDENEMVRWTTVFALENIGVTAAPALVLALVVSLSDNDQVHDNLKRIKEFPTQAFNAFKEIKGAEDWNVEKLEKFAESSLELIMAVADNPDVRYWQAVEVLRELGIAAIPSLEFFASLGMLSGNTSEMAIQALAELGDTAVPSLVQKWPDVDWQIFINKVSDAKKALDDAKTAYWIEKLKDSDAKTRSKAAKILRRNGKGAAPALLKVLRDQDKHVRRTALQSLGKIRDTASAPALAKALWDEEQDVSAAAAWALKGLGQAAIPFLVEVIRPKKWFKMFDQRDWFVRQEACRLLGDIGDAAAVPVLIKALRDMYIEQIAAEALGKIGDIRAIPALIKHLSNNSSEVRITVIRSLKQMVHKVEDEKELRKIQRALWWRLTDKDRSVAEIAFDTLTLVVERLMDIHLINLQLEEPFC